MKTVYPAEGRLVRDPHTGREVTGPLGISENDPFWIRRIADEDVSETPTQAAVPGEVSDASTEVDVSANNNSGGEQ